jgi:invasion protein IalB
MNSLVGRLCALTLAASLAGASGAAIAQTKPAPAAPAPAAPAAGAPAQPPAQAAQPQGPVRLELQGLQTPWTKICGPGNTRQICYTTRDFGQAADSPPTLAVAVYELQPPEEGKDSKQEPKRTVRFLLPVALLLKPGFRLIIDKGEPISGQFAICFPNGCFAEADLNASSMAAMKKAQTMSVQVRNQGNNEVTFVVPMKDFAGAFEGNPIDPKVLEQQMQQQNEQLQKQLQGRAEQERQQLEKQQQSGASAPAAPAPAPAAK